MTANRKAQRKADEAKAAMAYMRRLHGDPATAPVDDLAEQADADYDAADVALGPEGEQTTDGGPCAGTAVKKRILAL